jgi:hypothetical protein
VSAEGHKTERTGLAPKQNLIRSRGGFLRSSGLHSKSAIPDSSSSALGFELDLHSLLSLSVALA